MENSLYAKAQRQVWTVSLILAPVFIIIAQFFWHEGMVTGTAGWLQVLAYTFWILAFHGMFSLIKEKMPVYASLGLIIAVYACIGGNNFGIDGVYMEAFGVNNLEQAQSMHDNFGIAKIITLYLPGALFPLSLLALGILYAIKKIVPLWIAFLLIIAALGFPLSRIPREPLYAHMDNLLLLVSHAALAMKIKTR